MAGMHLPEEGGSGWNVEHVKQSLPGQPVVLIEWAHRQQGLIVAPGNPRGIRTVADLGRPGLRFVARQPGSGTRLLTDALLESAGLEHARIVGSEHCEDSHLAVAASVACAVADAGLGIEAAARSFGLDFVPLVEERYCFVCLKPALEHPAVQALKRVLASEAWGRELAVLTGYRVDGGGQVLRLTEALPWWNELVATPRPRAVRSG